MKKVVHFAPECLVHFRTESVVHFRTESVVHFHRNTQSLDWIGKKAVVNHHKQVPFYMLRRNNELSAGDPDSKNLLVQGDNLVALKLSSTKRRHHGAMKIHGRNALWGSCGRSGAEASVCL